MRVTAVLVERLVTNSILVCVIRVIVNNKNQSNRNMTVVIAVFCLPGAAVSGVFAGAQVPASPSEVVLTSQAFRTVAPICSQRPRS